MADEPTLGEVMRRLDSLVSTVSDLVHQLREDRRHNANTYVRRDWQEEARNADHAMIREIAKDVAEMQRQRDLDAKAQRAEAERQSNFRRQVGLGAALGILSIAGMFGLAIFNLLVGA